MRLLLIALTVLLFSCGGGWSDEEKLKFVTECRKGVATGSVNYADAYCNCMLDKVTTRFESPTEFAEADDMDIPELAASCNDSLLGEEVVWPQETEQAFVKGCMEIMKVEAPTANGEKVCNCILQQVKVRYPRAKSVDAINPDTMQAVKAECMALIQPKS